MNPTPRRILQLFILALLMAPPVSCETGGNKTDANPFHIRLNITADSTIVCFGDSLTYGDGADSPPAESYPWWLQDMVDLEVVNSGESGNTSGDALARVQEDVLDHNPVIVIVELGANDYLNDLDPETTLDNLEAIINSCRASGAVVFLCRFFSDEMADEYSQSDPDGVETLITMYASLAERERVFLVEDIWGDIRETPGFMDDAAHPSGEGYQVMAQMIFEAMREMLEYNDIALP